ncbi:MAG: A/G-specific adenine glycosylase [Bacillota bacterium]|nr:A/G-specific adenine glycosylase [Bacillota bacterium]
MTPARSLPDPGPLLDWFSVAARDLPWRAADPLTGRRDPYRVWISEIMLQQTRAAAVIPYYERFLERYPDLDSLAAAEEDEVLKLWEGLGYYSRARNLLATARQVAMLSADTRPRTAAALRLLPGIGPYTAGAIASLSYDEAAPAVDGNVLRVLCRLLDQDWQRGDPAALRQAESLLDAWYAAHPGASPGRLNEALIELGARLCLPRRPLCPECPLAAACAARASGRAPELPLPRARRSRPLEILAPLFILHRGDLLCLRRPPTGLLGGLWQVPFVDGLLHPGQRTAIEAALEPLFTSARFVWEPLGSHRHVFSHLEWELGAESLTISSSSTSPDPGQLLDSLDAFLSTQSPPPTTALWLSATERRDLAFPAALHGFLDRL